MAHTNHILPICPKCNDTKFVKLETILICNPAKYCYKCTKCNFDWYGSTHLEYDRWKK